MSDDELSHIEKEAKEFILKNKKKYHVYKLIHQHMKDLTQETFQETLKFVKDNSDIFFKDHSSAINFFGFVKNSISSNVIHLELIFDILINFLDEFKRLNVTENEMFILCIQYINYVNYLFQKKVISLSTIIEQSHLHPLVFINFLPEIREYDPEYVQLREKDFFKPLGGPRLQSLIELKELVDSDPQLHIKNREINYHPSLLHKSIREDDIDTFQSILSKNEISINHRIEYSYYERTQPSEASTSLIQFATIYGAKKIIKFLLLQTDIILDDNLISYSYFSYDFDLIHYYEQKGCSLYNITYMPIYMHQKDILNYYLENHSEYITEENETIKNEIGNKFNSDDNLYNLLNYEDLQYSLLAYNYSVIKKCLPKIAFIVRNIELNKIKFLLTDYNNGNILLVNSGYQFDIFQFLCSQKVQTINKIEIGGFYITMFKCLERNMNDSFKYLFNDLNTNIDLKALFQICLEHNHDMANYILDLQIKEKSENNQNSNSLFNRFKNIINFFDFSLAVQYYNEDVVVKMFHLYDSAITDDILKDFVIILCNFLSNKMIIGLFEKIQFYLKNSNLLEVLKSLNFVKLLDMVKEKIEFK